METEKNKRVLYVDVARTIACIMVVLIHTCFSIDTNNKVQFSRLFFNILINDAVTLFWLIACFFLFNKKYVNLLKKNFFRLWLPATILGIGSCFGYNLYLLLFQSSKASPLLALLKDTLIGVMSFRNFAPWSAHFWFIYIYCLVIIAYPLLNKIVEIIDTNSRNKYIFIFLTILLFLINGITNNALSFGQHYFGGLVPASFQVIIGHIIYNEIEKYSGLIKKNKYYCLLASFLLRLLKTIIKYYFLSINIDLIIDKWFSLFSIIDSISLILVCYGFSDLIKDPLQKVVISISSLSLWIYMVHPYVIKVIRFFKIPDYLYGLLNGDNSLLGALLYWLLFFLIIFGISYIASIIITFLIKLVKERIKMNEKENI